MSKQRKQSAALPVLLMVVGALLIFGAGVWFLYILPAGSSVEVNEDQVPRLSVEEAKAAYDTGSVIFVDVRDAESYARGHIKGALSIPMEELSSRMDELDPSAWIVTY